jgi:DNA-nicking Smr family endonuclease
VKKRVEDDASDTDVFEREMADVVRLPADPRGRVRTVPRTSGPPRSREAAPRVSSGDHVQEQHEDFAAPGVDRREIRKLKRGDYAVDARLDLHGMTVKDAVARVKRFVEASRHQRCRCVAIVHGQGLHSEGSAPVLKPRVRECLRSDPSVLAYASAPRQDGGAGAVHVLLRK